MAIKELAAAAVVVGDIIGVVAVQKTLHELHKQAHPHYLGVIALCGVLAAVNLILIVSVVRSLGAKSAPVSAAPAPRSGYPTIGGRR